MSSCSKIGPKSSPYVFGLVSSLKIFPLALYPYETFVNPSSLFRNSFSTLFKNESAKIFGDGLQSRDFTFVENAIQANVKAMLCTNEEAFGKAVNIAFGSATSVIELYNHIKDAAGASAKPEMCGPRLGDIRDSLADISKAQKYFNYDS